jgi:hypothetical protein
VASGDIVGEAPGASVRIAGVGDGLADAAADGDGVAPISEATSGTLTFQCAPAAPAMMAAPAIHREASAANEVAPPSLLIE